jgi:DHA1 family tetracycline resistance protein-like MFS transporter
MRMSNIRPNRMTYTAVGFASFADSVASGIQMVAIPLLVIQLDGGPLAVALVISIQSVGGALGSVVLGRIGDRISRVGLLLLVLSALTACYLLQAFAPDLAGLFLLRAASGFLASNLVLLESFVSDITSHQARSAGLARLRLGSTLGLIVGPSIAGVLSGTHLVDDVRGLILVSAALVAAEPLVLSWALRGRGSMEDRQPQHTAAYGEVLQRFLAPGRIRDFALIKALVSACFVMMMAIAPSWTSTRLGWGAADLSALVATFGVALLVIQLPLASNWCRWLTSDPAACAFCLLLVPAFLALAVWPGSVGIFLCCAALGLTSAVVNIAAPVAISRLAGTDVGALLGLMATTTLITGTTSPLIFGAIYEWFGDAWTWCGGAAIASVAAMLAWQHAGRSIAIAHLASEKREQATRGTP